MIHPSVLLSHLVDSHKHIREDRYYKMNNMLTRGILRLSKRGSKSGSVSSDSQSIRSGASESVEADSIIGATEHVSILNLLGKLNQYRFFFSSSPTSVYQYRG